MQLAKVIRDEHFTTIRSGWIDFLDTQGQSKEGEYSLQSIGLVQSNQFAEVDKRSGSFGMLVDPFLGSFTNLFGFFTSISPLFLGWPIVCVFMRLALHMRLDLHVWSRVWSDLGCWGNSNQCDQCVEFHFYYLVFYLFINSVQIIAYKTIILHLI